MFPYGPLLHSPCNCVLLLQFLLEILDLIQYAISNAATMAPRREKSELSPQLRSRILELRSIGWSLQKIATKHQLPKSTVQYTVDKAKDRPETQESSPRRGAPRVISEDQRDALYEAVTSTPGVSFEALQAKVAPDVSTRTIRKALHEMDLRKFKRLKRPALSEIHA